MAAFISWYLIITLLGWLTFPLVYALFPAIPDRGYSLARAAGLLLWGYLFWLLNSLGLMQNNSGGVIFGLLLVAAVSFSSFFLPGSKAPDRKVEILIWLRTHLRLILTVEVLFLLTFAFLAFVRAGNPELDNAEKPMELMFINAILRSPTFPPHDSWLSGYAISYYYFGYVMTAMLAMLTGLTGSVAHNLMTSLIFGLAAIGAYGILYNLLAAGESRTKNREPAESASTASTESNSELPTTDDETRISEQDPQFTDHDPQATSPDSRFVAPSLLAPLFLLLVSNLEGFMEVLHGGGVFWSGTQNFWTWLGIKELSDPPTQPLSWIPERFWWWWRASRVISDYDLADNFREVIDEFPFFSFLHADLHPHVLAIPFNLLAVAVALNLVLGGWRGETNLFGLRLKIHKTGFFAAALLLGGLAFLNTWDILIAAALIIFAYVLLQVHEEGWSWSRLEDVFALGLPLGVLAALLYLPFYFGFSSQAGGILPNLTNPTRGAQLWVMFAPLFVPIFAYLLYIWRGRHWKGNWTLSLVLVVGLTVFLWALSWLIGWLAFIKDPGFAEQFLGSQGVADTASFFAAAMLRRFSYIGGLLTLLALLVPALAFLINRTHSKDDSVQADFEESAASDPGPVSSFIFLLMILGGLLVLAPEFVFLRDQFASRLNTVFKFYYQAWMLWSLAAAYGVAVLLRRLRGVWAGSFVASLVILILVSIIGFSYLPGNKLYLLLLLLVCVVGLVTGVIALILRRTWGGVLASYSLVLLFVSMIYVPLLQGNSTYEGWLFWVCFAGFTIAILAFSLRRMWGGVFAAFIVTLLFVSLTYPALAIPNKTNGFKPYLGWTLDDFQRIERNNPDEASAMLWLKSAPDGVIAEAVGGSYTNYARISEYTGLPAVLGWPGHESQWRGTYDPQGSRQDDIAQLYSTPNWETAQAIIQKYNVKYIYIGDLERSTYPVQEEKFQRNLTQVFKTGVVTIYAVP